MSIMTPEEEDTNKRLTLLTLENMVKSTNALHAMLGLDGDKSVELLFAAVIELLVLLVATYISEEDAKAELNRFGVHIRKQIEWHYKEIKTEAAELAAKETKH